MTSINISENKTNFSSYKRFLRMFLTLSIPTILEMCMATILQYVDTAMVGHLGANATAAVSLSSTYTWLINNIFTSIGMGFLAYVARAIGEDNTYKTRHAAGMALGMGLFLGTLVTIITMCIASQMPVWMGADPAIHHVGSWYFRIINMTLIFRALQMILASVLRSTGDTKTPMKINVFINVMNILLNGIFIYGFHLGAIGAGIGTALSFAAGGILMIHAFVKNKYVKVSLEYLKPEWIVLRDILRIGIPAMLTGMISCVGYIVATSFVSSMATVIFAAHSIAITAEQMFYIPSYGMQAATSTLIGNALGEGDKRKERGIMKVALMVIFLLMVLTGGLLFAMATWMMTLFTKDPEVIQIGARLLRIVALSEPIYGVAIVAEGIFIGLGRTKIPLVVEIIGRWCIRILGGYCWIHFFGGGINEFWYVMVSDNAIRALLLMLCLTVIIRKENRELATVLDSPK